MQWLRIGFWDPAVSWMGVFVTKINGFWLLVIVTKDLVLNVAGVPYPLLFCSYLLQIVCFAFLVLIFICYDRNKLITNMLLYVYFFWFENKIYFTFIFTSVCSATSMRLIIFIVKNLW